MSADANGADRETILEERRRDREAALHRTQLQFDNDGQLSKETLEALVDTDDLQGRTVSLLRNMLSRQWMLANLTDAQAHDKWWMIETLRLKVLGQHPPPESAIQGPLRAFLFDNPQEGLWALTAAERGVIDTLFETLQVITTRSRDGFERRQLNTAIRQSQTDRLDNGLETGKSKGRLRGLFSR